MSDEPEEHDSEQPAVDQAPELANSEQSEADQAQDVAAQAIDRATSAFGLDDTEKVGGGFDDVDTQDLVDHMNQMVSSGHIDMSAYAGEPVHDDEDGSVPVRSSGTSGGESEDDAIDGEDFA